MEKGLWLDVVVIVEFKVNDLCIFFVFIRCFWIFFGGLEFNGDDLIMFFLVVVDDMYLLEFFICFIVFGIWLCFFDKFEEVFVFRVLFLEFFILLNVFCWFFLIDCILMICMLELFFCWWVIDIEEFVFSGGKFVLIGYLFGFRVVGLTFISFIFFLFMFIIFLFWFLVVFWLCDLL